MLAVLVYPGFASIAEDESAGFIIENGELTGYTGSGGDITLPDTVTGIRDSVFSGNLSITSVTIPASVVSIGAGAFSGCSNLYHASVPSSVVNMGNGVFSGCTSLSDLQFSASVGMIPDMTFYGCASLPAITIPSTVSSIGGSAFENCSLISTIDIPAAVSSISDTAFSGCGNLSSVNVDPGNSTYSSYDGCVYNKTQTTLYYCPEGKYGIKLPTSVTTLSYASMNRCIGITDVDLPSGAASIENNVFSNSGVESITIPKSVTSIGTQSSWTPQMIYTYSGSAGEKFAVSNNYTYELLDSPASAADPDSKENDDPKNPDEDGAADADDEDDADQSDDGSADDSDAPAATSPTNTGNSAGGGTGISGGTASGSSYSNGVHSASQTAASQHVLDTTPKTGPELNAKIVLCMAVFFVGIYLIISSRREDSDQTA